MSRTFQNVADRARTTLNDAAKAWWPDADLFGFTSDAVLILRSRRPDLFIGQWASLPEATASIIGTATLPVPDEYFVPITNYVLAMAHGKDAEEAAITLVPMFMGMFRAGT